MKALNKNSTIGLRAHSSTVKSVATVTVKQLEKPLDQSTKDWIHQSDKHMVRMSKDENYRLLVAKSLS